MGAALARSGACLALTLLFTTAALAVPEAPAPDPVQEDVLPLEELLKQGLKNVPRGVQVSTASRFAQGADHAPSITYVLTDQQIHDLGLRDMADVLRALPGLYTTSNGNFTYLGARGLGRPDDYNSRVLVLVDGVRINENMTDAALLGPEFLIDVDLIDRVEFTPGPGSALYGNNAFWGVINVITKRVDKLAGLRLRTHLDNQHGRSLMATLGHRFTEGAEAWLSVNAYEQVKREPVWRLPNELNLQYREMNDSRGGRLVGGVNVSGWGLRWGFSDRRIGLPIAQLVPDGMVLLRGAMHMRNGYVSSTYDTHWGAFWDFGLDASIKTTDLLRDAPFIDGTGARHLEHSRSQGGVVNLGLRLGASHWKGHYLLMGMDLQRDYQQRTRLAYDDVTALEYGTSSRNVGLFLQDEWQISPRHRLVLGVRADRDDRVGGINTHPRLAWLWSVRDDALLRVNYGSAYRAANVLEFLTNAVYDLAEPQPETVRSIELAWEQRLTPQLRYRFSWYQGDLRNLISRTTKPAPIYVNDAPIRSRGVELGLERRWDGGALVHVSLSLQRSQDAAGESLYNSPKSLFKLAYSRPLIDTVHLGWQLQAMSHRLSPFGRLPGYAINHLTLQWDLKSQGQLSLGVYNLGDIRYLDASELQSGRMKQEGRMLRLSYALRFGS